MDQETVMSKGTFLIDFLVISCEHPVNYTIKHDKMINFGFYFYLGGTLIPVGICRLIILSTVV